MINSRRARFRGMDISGPGVERTLTVQAAYSILRAAGCSDLQHPSQWQRHSQKQRIQFSQQQQETALPRAWARHSSLYKTPQCSPIRRPL